MGSKAEREAKIAAADALLLNDGKTQSTNEETLNTDPSKRTETSEPETRIPAASDSETRTPPANDSEQTWERKYLVLQGKYNADVKRLNAEVKRLSEAQSPSNDQEILSLRQQIDSLKQQLSEKPSDQSDSKLTKSEHYQFLVDEYGEPLANAITSMIGSGGQASDEVGQLREQVNTITKQNAEQAEESKFATISAMLQGQGINFDQVNNDPMFVEWLNQDEGNTGTPRLQFMNNHFANGKLNQVAKYFTDFKAQERSSFDNNSLSEYASVEGNGATMQDGDQSEDIWTSENIKALYADKRQGKISDAEFEKWEQQLNRASAEGRVRQ